MRISEVAKAVGVNVETVRYYQRIGVLRVPQARSGTRQYEAQDVVALRFIRRAQALGFTLAEIATLIQLSSADCHDVERIARDRIEQVREKIRTLRLVETALAQVIERCTSRMSHEGCPVIETLAGDV